mmetsp:Transcript_13595/g.25009  ORF Transcript_13595/g.25009 Transcript_13595/m.25009 type:complete len:303 (+) Transcript_13595:876-1784(+)|eukprot:CAMPEP_0182518838 /NCGR_PEP_ID=MMETSP1321-20130603/44781_1 /TAXON_ID=91990 /ORGANISM="Bolidomonas sp., Strain RCC1657" /LENGTH=302 /DNA_ID=CAMNT_0024726779 /DNA_START=874 /DNA_END=1782 /DNA_ORIENTATION=+
MTEQQQQLASTPNPVASPDDELLNDADLHLLSAWLEEQPPASLAAATTVVRASSGSSSSSSVGVSSTTSGSVSNYSSDGSESPTMNPSSSSQQKRKGRSKVDKATERKMKNRESAKNSYLKKKAQTAAMEDRIKELEAANAALTSENGLLREENSQLKAALQDKERELLIEDIPLPSSLSGSGSTLPLYNSSGGTNPNKRHRSSDTTTPTRSDYSTSNAIKLVTLPIAAISSTLCMLDNTSNADTLGSRFSGSMVMIGGGNVLPTWVLILMGVLAGVVMLGVRNSWFPSSLRVQIVLPKKLK